MTTATHHLRLFGVPQLLDPQGQSVTLRTRKHLALLVYIALEARDKPVFRNVLADLIWPDVCEERGRHSLSQALTEIRSHLGKDSFSKSSIKVQLLSGLTTDVDPGWTENLRPGDLALSLSGMDSGVGASFAHWVDRARVRCVQQVRTELIGRLTNARNLGRLEDAHGIAALLYAVDPLSDQAVLTLAEQHLLAGDQAEVIELLRSHFARSKEELGRRPPRCMLLLSQRVERGLEPQPLPSLGVEAEQRPTLTQPEVFIDREDELSGLEAAWTAACRGKLVTCLISGPPGIGKSALVRRFATSLTARTWPAFLVACQEIGRRIPFAAVSDLTIRLTRDPALSGTDPMWLAEASRVTPGLRAIYAGVPEPPPAPPEAVRVRVAEALLRMLECIADGGPLLLVFDSIQHLDPASQDVLHVLARRLETSPILLVGTMQSDELDHAMISAEATSGIEWHQQIELRPLDPARTQELVTRLMPDSEDVPEEMVDDIAELSQGNPYLTEMLVSDWRNNGGDSLVALERRHSAAPVSWRPPGTMRLAFAKQYQGLSKDAQHLLHLLAVASRAIATDELERLLAFAPVVLDHAALELIDRSLIRTDSRGLGFRNELHRAFVYYHEMSEDARKYHHARLAKCLAFARAEDDFQRALEASHHYLKAKMVDEAIRAVCLGAELAVTRGAPKEAERELKAVLSSCNTDPQSRLHLLLARAQAAQGKYREALNTLTLWNPRTPTTLQKAQAATIRTEAFHRGRLADDRTIQRTLGEALALADAAGDERVAMQALQLSAEVASETGNGRAMRAVSTKAASMEHASAQPNTKALARFTQGYCLLVTGDVFGARLQFLECVRLLEGLSLDCELRQAFNGLGVAQYCLGLYTDGIASFKTAIAIASRIGDSIACATSWSNLGAVHEDLGDFTAAENCYQQAMSLEAQASNPRRAVEVHLNMASLRLVTGDLKDASRCLNIAINRANESQLWWLTTDVLLAQADYNIAINCPEAAWPLVEEAQANTRGRVYLLSNRGRFERLRRHHLWITQGWTAVERLSETENLNERCVQLSGRFEISATEDWIRLCERIGRPTPSPAFDELRARQLHGILSRLEALQIRDRP